MQRLQQRLAVVRGRQQRQWMGYCLSWGLVIGGTAACVAGIARLSGIPLSAGWIAAPLVVGPLAGLLVAILFRRSEREAAIATDRHYDLKDRITTAWAFLRRGDLTLWQSLQVSDAETHLDSVDPVLVAPYDSPRPLPYGVMLAVAAIGLGFLSTAAPEAVASLAPNDVVTAQATRVDDELAELEQFNKEDPNPEIEQLIKELAQKIDELRQPGLEPKEALAKLSEMETSLQAQQEQLASPQMNASLQATGETLALAEAMQAAGQAMAEGKLDEAAEQLPKIDLPKLDRQTEKAISEKLDQLAKNAGDGKQRQLQEALSQIAAGLTGGEGSKFKDGMQGLAGEAKKQGRRNKLADLLRKQCQCLCECKGECESECQKQGQCNKPGGNKWGLAASGNEPGDKTPLLKSPHQMNITGQESAQGDVDLETTHTPEARQEAIRQYKEKVDKYTQLSESVLDSEPIPLGHRQTIRKYFELIRPQGNETDAVVERSTSP